MPKLILIRGPMAAGKSTICAALFDELDYIFVDRAAIKNGMFKKMKDRELAKTLSKDACLLMLRELMLRGENLLIQEFAVSSIHKHLGDLMQKYDYEFYSFFLRVSLETAARRDEERQDRYKRYVTVKEIHEKTHPEPQDVVLDTEALTVTETVAEILKTITKPPKTI